MTYLVDTNIVSAHLRRPAGLQHRFVQHGGRIAIPTIALAELLVWAFGKADPNPVLKLVQELLDDLTVLEFDVPSAYEFGELRVNTSKGGHHCQPSRPDDRLHGPCS